VRRAPALAALAAAAALVAAGCGGSASGRGGRPALVVSAASSLRNAFADYARGFRQASVRLSFGGSDALAAQIRAGVKPDVVAAANTTLPDELFAERRVEKPVVFTANRLVLAVPAQQGAIHSLADLARPHASIAIGAASVPVGPYMGQVLASLPAAEQRAIMANVRSEEPDVAGIVGKLTQGAVRAGFLYATDVVATKGALRAIALPARLQPKVVYEAAVVEGAAHPAQARRFVAGLRAGAGQAALRRAGFLPLPR